MNRVGTGLARGIVVAAVLLGGGPLADPAPSPVQRALALIRGQDFTPLFDIAGRRVTDAFDPKKQDRFLEDLFSLAGKWRAVTRSRESYERYVRKEFEEKVFGSREFDRIVAEIRADYEYQTAALENRLLVELYDDIRLTRPGLRFGDFRAEFDILSSSLAPCVIRDLGMNLVSFAGSDSAAVLMVAALSSAGILGTSVAGGTAGGPMTFGVSLVVGIIAGIALDAVVGEAFEDVARLETRTYVNGLRNRILDGVHDALVRALLAYRTLEERCVMELYQGGSRGHVVARP